MELDEINYGHLPEDLIRFGKESDIANSTIRSY